MYLVFIESKRFSWNNNKFFRQLKNMKNQFFKENIFCINKIKDILKSKDINLDKITLENEFILPDYKIKIFENIFESKKLIECNENLFVDEENYFIKANSLIYHYETQNSYEKYIEEKYIKKDKKKEAKEKIFLIEKIDKKKRTWVGEKRKKNIGLRLVIINLTRIILLER